MGAPSNVHLDQKHLPALDGIRGIAVLLVILFHYAYVESGWVGVQIFFVLSGYLITSILLGDSDLAVGLYLKRFYWRRTLRVFPIYYGYILILAIVYFLTGQPGVFHRDWAYLLSYTTNYRLMLPDAAGSNFFYGRFWSLAVEEQFYIIWPAALYFFPRKHLLKLLVAMVAAGPFIRIVASHWLEASIPNPQLVGHALYYFTPCQLDAFAAGALLVLLGDRLRTRSLRILLAVSALVLVCGQLSALANTGGFVLNTSFGYEATMIQGGKAIWGYSLIDIWAACAILAATSRNWFANFLATPALVYLGKISYGMYVYHHLLQYWFNQWAGPLPRHSAAQLSWFLCYFSMLVILSSLSFHFFERRFLGLKDARFPRSGTPLAAKPSIFRYPHPAS